MTLTFLLVAVGALDLTRSRRRGARWVVSAAVGVLLLAFGWLGLGLSPFVTLAILAIGFAWLAVMPWSGRTEAGTAPAPSRLWPVAGLAAAIVGASALDVLSPPSSQSPLELVYSQALVGAGGGPTSVIRFAVITAAIGVGLVLVQTSNVIVRAALGPVVQGGDVAADGSRSAKKRLKKTAEAAQATTVASGGSRPGLKGGRLIGPLERVLILVLAFTGMFTVIAAVIAAKGVVRFPEIAGDKGEGSKAEEFLVGTLTSCALAAAGGLYLYAVSR